MNEEVLALWLKALRGGYYSRARRELKKTVYDSDSSIQKTQYCVFGVLCRLAEKKGIVQFERVVDACNQDHSWRCYSQTNSDDWSECYPPNAVCEWAGIDPQHVDDAEICNNGPIHKLIVLNDEGIGFWRMATWIEENREILGRKI